MYPLASRRRPVAVSPSGRRASAVPPPAVRPGSAGARG